MKLLPRLVSVGAREKMMCIKHWILLYTGHEVVRLSVAHCELNPIEMAWAWVKQYIRGHHQNFTLAEVERLIHEEFEWVTPELWKQLLSHVEKRTEGNYWKEDGLFHTRRHKFIIHLGDSSNDSSSTSDDSSFERLICFFHWLKYCRSHKTMVDLPATQCKWYIYFQPLNSQYLVSESLNGGKFPQITV